MPRHSTQNNTQDSTQGNTVEIINDMFKVKLTEFMPERGVLATAEVRVGDLMTIRNVKIKEDDYGLTVTMPRTKVARSDQYKDSLFFTDKSMKEAFDQAVKAEYQHRIIDQAQEAEPEQEDTEELEDAEAEEGMGMSQGM